PGSRPGEYFVRKSLNDGVVRPMKPGIPCEPTRPSQLRSITLTLLPWRSRQRNPLSAHGEPADRRTGQVDQGQKPRPRHTGPYWPPFWTYERTNSSAFSSRTSSISRSE